MTDINELAVQFTNFYYKNFDTNRSQLASLYRPNSMLTFENSQIQGTERIIQKLMELPFVKVLHKIATIDAQPSMLSGGSIIVMVTGQLLVDEEQNPQQYSQTFHLIPEGNTFYVLNDIFRLNYS